MDALFTRADREIAIEDFGPSRVIAGINRLRLRRGRFGLGILNDDAVDELLDDLVADARLEERLNAENRAIRQGHVPVQADRAPSHGVRA